MMGILYHQEDIMAPKTILIIICMLKNPMQYVTTLASGLQPRQRLAKLAKNEAWESHFMIMGVWENVKESTHTLPNGLSFWELEFR
jgi:hypothetical protein